MEIDDQKRTYQGFTSVTKWSIIVVTVIMLLMTNLI